MSRIALHFLPWIIPAMVGIVYSWLNMGQRLFVERLGCGCPSLDGSFHFNTNHLTMTIAFLGAASSGGLCIWRSRTMTERKQMAYVIAGGVVIGGISIFWMVRNFWL
jgi:hypothetical protein